jgi:hypothetical protein
VCSRSPEGERSGGLNGPRRGQQARPSRLSAIHPMCLCRNICRPLADFRRAVDKCDVGH